MARLEKVKKVHITGIGNIPLKGNTTTFKPASEKREGQDGELPGDHGFTATPQPAILDVTLQASSTISIDELNSVEQLAIQVTLESGKFYTMNNAYCSEPFELGQGECKGQFTSGTTDFKN